MTKDEELIERLANARRIVRDECGDIPQYVRTCIEAALADATDRLEALARPVVGVQIPMALMQAVEDFINEPQRSPDIEPMEVRDYRHALYRVWSPLCQAILTANTAALAASPAPAIREPIKRMEHISDSPFAQRCAPDAAEVAGPTTRTTISAPVVGDREALQEAHDAIDQALDDMGVQGHCVCPEAKDWLGSARTKAANALSTPVVGGAPIPMVLHCPKCGLQHVDAPDEEAIANYDPADVGVSVPWTNPPHRSHLCHGCGCIWRPADIATCGVSAIASKGSADNWAADAPPRPSHHGQGRNGAGGGVMRVSIITAALLIAGCSASDRVPDKEPVWDCVDARDGHHFQYSPSQTTDEVLNLTGENYGYYTEPNGTRHRISQSWVETNCKIVRWKGGAPA